MTRRRCGGEFRARTATPLEHPFRLGEARRAVPDPLEFTCDRKFADRWAFVAFAEREHPELDLLTPPGRPERK
jgi:hypothetical protein